MRYAKVLAVIGLAVALAPVAQAGDAARESVGRAAPPEAEPPVADAGTMAACAADFGQVKARLAADFAERPVSGGLQEDGNLLSIFASARTGSWTIVTTTPDGHSCIVAVGEAWQNQVPGAGAAGYRPASR